jgi:Domain of unknown function (DUF4397)
MTTLDAPNTFRGWSATWALVCALALSACGGGDDDKGRAQVRALNLSSDIAQVDLLVDDTRLFTALAPDVLSPVTSREAGSPELKVRRSGESADLLTGAFTLSKDKQYTAIVWGRETATRLITLPEDETDSDIATGNTRLRIFNATIDTGSVDVFITSTHTDINEASPTQASVASGQLGGFREFGRGTYRLRVTGAGDPRDLRLDVPAITLNEKKHATLVLTPGPGGVLVHATLIEQRGDMTLLKNRQARVRLVASVADAGNVSATLAGSTLVGGLRSPSVGPYALVPSGTADLVVRVNGATVPATVPAFVAGADYTLLAYGAASAPLLRVLTDDNRLPTTANRTRVRLVNGTALPDPITLSVDFSPVAFDVAAGQASPVATTTSGSSVRVDVTAAFAATALYTTTELNLQSLSLYSVFLLGGNSTPTGVVRKER